MPQHYFILFCFVLYEIAVKCNVKSSHDHFNYNNTNNMFAIFARMRMKYVFHVRCLSHMVSSPTFFFHNLIYFLFGANRWHDLCMHDIKIRIIFVNHFYINGFSFFYDFTFLLQTNGYRHKRQWYFSTNYFCQMTNLFLSIFQVRIINNY